MNPKHTFQVMVVEDETIILNYLIQKIQQLPLPISVAASFANGEDALAAIKNSRPDIVFTDVRMPVRRFALALWIIC